MGLRECGSKVRFWSEVCGSNWETHSLWILARWVWGNVDRRSGFGRRCVDWKCVDRTENLTHRGSDRDWEMERKLTVGLRLALVGLWVELWGMRVECTAMRSACESLCCYERAQTVLCEEWKLFEVKIWTEMTLRVFWVILWSKGKSISVDWIYWFNQTLKFYRKAFPKVIWSQNKHSLMTGF